MKKLIILFTTIIFSTPFINAQTTNFTSFYVSTEGPPGGTVTLVKENPKNYTGKVVEWQFKLFKKGVPASINSKDHTGLISSKTLAGAIKRLENCQWVDKAYAKFFSLSHDQTCDCCNYVGPIAKLSYIRTSDAVINNINTALDFEDWAEKELAEKFNTKEIIEAVNKEMKKAGSYTPGAMLKDYVKLLKSSKDNLNALQYKISSFNYQVWLEVESDMLIVYGDVSDLKEKEPKVIASSGTSKETSSNGGGLFNTSWKDKSGNDWICELSLNNGVLLSKREVSYTRQGKSMTTIQSYTLPLQALQSELTSRQLKISFSEPYYEPAYKAYQFEMKVPDKVREALFNKNKSGLHSIYDNGVKRREEKNTDHLGFTVPTLQDVEALKSILCKELRLCSK